jgi:hypothetical protein
VHVFLAREGRFEWRKISEAGSFVHIPGDVKHAFRNTSDQPIVQLITTTPMIGRFFREVGKRVAPGEACPAPTAEDLKHFVEVAKAYHHWIGSPAENAAIGIVIPDKQLPPGARASEEALSPSRI